MGNVNALPDAKNAAQYGQPVSGKKVHISDLKEILQREIREYDELINGIEVNATTTQKRALRDKMLQTEKQLNVFNSSKVK